ncbi:hypothetical protein NG753_09665 [Aliarcobacter cryaerophilus]
MILSKFRNVCQNGYNRLGIEKYLIDFLNVPKDKININSNIEIKNLAFLKIKVDSIPDVLI